MLADDIDTLKLARTGLDRTANTADDYNVTLTYGGLQPSGAPECDVTLDFDDTQTGFAVCQTGGVSISSPSGSNNDVRITSAKAFFNTQANWFFNDVPNDDEGGDGGGGAVQSFSFNDQIGVPPSSVRTSNSITVQGPSEPVEINVAGGSYSIGCSDRFVSSARTINSGETVCVRHTASATGGGTVDTTLTIGGVSDTFSSSAALQPGEPLTNLSGGWDSQQFFGFPIPSGATNLVVSISVGTGDADLYVRFGAPPTLEDYDSRPFLDENNEACSFPEPDAGDWFVLINGFDAYSGNPPAG